MNGGQSKFSFGKSSFSTPQKTGTTNSSSFATPQTTRPSSFSFGSNSAKKPATSGFSFGGGAKTANTSAFGGSASKFGGGTSAFGSSSSTFGGGANTGGTSFGMPRQYSLQEQQAGDVIQKLLSIISFYDTDNPYCRFRHVFYNLREQGDVLPRNEDMFAYFTQSGVLSNDEATRHLWHVGLLDNPDPEKLYPFPETGFENLEKRIKLQHERTKDDREWLSKAKEFVDTSDLKHDENLSRIEGFRRRYLSQSLRLLRVMSKIEILRTHGHPITIEEENWRERLERFNRELQNPLQYKGQLNELWSKVHMQAADVPRGEYEQLDEDSIEGIAEFLEQQRKGLDELLSIVRTDIRDLSIMLNDE